MGIYVEYLSMKIFEIRNDEKDIRNTDKLSVF